MTAAELRQRAARAAQSTRTRFAPDPRTSRWDAALSRRCARQVSVVIPSAGSLDEFGASLVEGALELVAHLAPVYVVTTNSNISALGADACERYGARIVDVQADGFNFSTAINAGVAATSTPYVLLLNDDIRGPAPRGWLHWWLGQHADLSGVGLRWPNGLVACGGILWSTIAGMPGHRFAGDPVSELPPEPPTLAVTGAAVLVRRTLFDAIGGFYTGLPLNYNDIDFCVQALACGVVPRQFNRIVLTHKESASRGHTPPTAADYHVFEERCATTLARHGVTLSADEAVRSFCTEELADA